MVVLTGGVSLDTPSKYKRRKLSPIRDFPEGCGISKPSEKYPVLVGFTESLKADTLSSPKALTEKALNEKEAVKAMEALKPVVVENMMVLDHKEVVRPSKTLEPESSSSSKNTNQMELLKSKNYSTGFECNHVVKNTLQLEEVDQPQTSISALSMHKYYPPPRRTLVSRDFPPDCCTRIATSRDSPGCCTRIAASRDFPPGCGEKALELSKEERLKLIDYSKNQCSENQKARGDNMQLELMVMIDNGKTENVQDGDAFKSKLEGDLIKKSASSENLTPGIKSYSGENRQLEKVVGDDAEKFTWNVKDEGIFKTIRKEDDIQESMDSARKEDAIKESMDSAQVNSGQDVLKAMAERDQIKFPLVSKNVKREPSEKEFEELSKDNSLKRKLPGNSVDGSYYSSQPRGEESKGLGPNCNREVVLALMAAPHCPWRQEKVSKSPPSREVSKLPPTRGLIGGKKRKKDTHVNSEVISMKKDGSRSLEVKSTKRKRPPSVTYHNIDDQLVFRDEFDSPSDEDDGNIALVPFGFHAIVDKHDTEAVITRNKVRETLRLFQAISRKLLREDEAKLREKHNGKRIDIISADILKDNGKWVNTGKQILGTVPGVEVGDEFHYRVELAIVGLHHPYQGGIDYLRQGDRTLATSIVFSGRYDDIDCSASSDILVYSGQGGNPKIKGSRQSEDQRLERGNLALKNSMDESSPVRVIRGFKPTKADAKGKIVVTYTYDGLYLVEDFWQEKGPYGYKVFKFQLRRIQGQPELALKEVKKSKQLRVRDGLCVVDISQGKEKMPICAINTIDNEKPPPFKYITSMIYPSWYNPTPPKGCQCTNECSDSGECVCANKNGGEIPFNYDGDIMFAKPLVYECGPSCKCPPSCHNRVSQHGIRFQLEIFKTESTGWGVRSLTSILSGSFVCEYTGELLEDKEAEQRTGSDEYLFDIGKNYNDHTLWEGLSNLMPPDLQSSISCDTVEDGGFSIDALKYGNVGRFINHSCSPNLYAQNVLYDHDDKRIPHVMLFAAENIPPLQELTYHYNYKIGQVLDSSGNIKKKDCCCGSDECSGRLY